MVGFLEESEGEDDEGESDAPQEELGDHGWVQSVNPMPFPEAAGEKAGKSVP